MEGEVWRLDNFGRYWGGDPLFSWEVVTEPEPRTIAVLEKRKGLIDQYWRRTGDSAAEKRFTSTQEAVRQMKDYGKPEWMRQYCHYRGPSVRWDLAVFWLGWLLLLVAAALVSLGSGQPVAL
jgi:hypothetical protein